MSWLGETTPDAGPGGLNGYLVGTAIFGVLLVVLVWRADPGARASTPGSTGRRSSPRPPPGTTLADFADRSLGIGYPGGSLLLLACVLAVAVRLVPDDRHDRRQLASSRPREELFYWITITFSQTLGTALGDWVADDGGLGYSGGALVFGAALAVLAALYCWTRFRAWSLFWAAFILTRPLGATVGDFLDKPLADGGLALSRPLATAVLAALIVALILLLPQRPGTHPKS